MLPAGGHRAQHPPLGAADLFGDLCLVHLPRNPLGDALVLLPAGQGLTQGVDGGGVAGAREGGRGGSG
ncbi:hypothetical protein GCM10009642_63350 [Nocardiopsis metallicus]